MFLVFSSLSFPTGSLSDRNERIPFFLSSCRDREEDGEVSHKKENSMDAICAAKGRKTEKVWISFQYTLWSSFSTVFEIMMMLWIQSILLSPSSSNQLRLLRRKEKETQTHVKEEDQFVE